MPLSSRPDSVPDQRVAVGECAFLIPESRHIFATPGFLPGGVEQVQGVSKLQQMQQFIRRISGLVADSRQIQLYDLTRKVCKESGEQVDFIPPPQISAGQKRRVKRCNGKKVHILQAP